MLGDGHATSPSEGGDAVGRSNGSFAAGSQRSTVAGVTNGTHKSTLGVNGSNGVKAARASVQRPSTYFGHDTSEVTRLLIQTLSDLGYDEAAELVGSESGYKLESPTVAAFRSAVLGGSWAEAERLLYGAADAESGAPEQDTLILAPGADRNLMRCWLRTQKFLELLEQRDTARALSVLREELTPIYSDTSKLHFLSSLLMCQSFADIEAKTKWDGANGDSRRALLSRLSRCISPSVMLPESRLAVLLQQVKQSQIDTCLYHTAASPPSLYSDHSCQRERFPTEVALELQLDGEAWRVQFSPDGSMLAACGSSDHVMIWGKHFQFLCSLDGHGVGGVGNIVWSPGSTMIVTCSQDKLARLWDVRTGELLKQTRTFGEPVIGCVWSTDGRSFVVGTLDKNHSLCTYNIDDDEVIEWGKKHRVQDLCGSPDGRWLVAVDDSTTIHVYNAETRELEYEMELKSRPTSVSISRDSRHLLVNKKDGEAQLIDILTRESIQKFLGHTGGDFLIRSSFGGANESFVTSGSDDGNILIWHKTIGAAVERLHGHIPRCNAVSWKPDDPSMLATCGDDGIIKIWTDKARSKPEKDDERYYFAELES